MKHGFRLLQDIIPDAILMAAEDIADYDEEIEESTPKRREKKGKKSKTVRSLLTKRISLQSLLLR